tara:strand:- start:1051 stop:1800 length:750 start_codon:yes stop_codon:yes gene_type:complete
MQADKTIKKFNKDGYVVLKSVFSSRKIQEYLEEINKLSKKLINSYQSPFVNLTKDEKVNTGHNLNIIFPNSSLMKISKNKTISNILKKLFNEKAVVRNLEIFLKPPKTGMKAPFHQDNYYWNLKDKRAVNLWIALDKVDKNNGGLIYLKGSHNGGILKHKMSKIKGTSQEIDKNIIRKLKYKKVYTKLNPGDCVMHHCEIVHGSNANNTNRNRRAIVISLKALSSKINKANFQKYQSRLKKHIKKYSLS